MLKRRICSNGVVIYESPLLSKIGIAHGFSTRLGGASPAPFDSLNLGTSGDLPDNVKINEDLLLNGLGLRERQVRKVKQVHGCAVETFEQSKAAEIQADAMVTSDRSLVLSIRVADCIPVLLASSDGKIVAAVHAGWRGIVAGVIPRAIDAMRIKGAQSFLAAVGAGISVDHFQVGPEVLTAFENVFGQTSFIHRDQPAAGRVDLQAAVFEQLRLAKIDDHCVDLTDRCTFRDQHEFFSHRRDQGVTGRMAALISPL